MRLLLAATAASLLAACASVAPRPAEPEPTVDIPYQKHVLDNGLTVILHEDHKAPIVAVNVWYHVGSKDEKPGRTGFAHLFEHLMFQGSENWPDEYFKPLERVGATEMNGTTWLDRTNYFQNVPSTALDLALWMESDRMGHFIDFVDQKLLDEQRGVVQNEKRQGENRPYGRVFEALQRASFPEGHPYRWTTIGSMEDLDAATLEDVREWFRTWYGAANATLVIAGDIDPEQTLAKVKRYFGDIPAGPPLQRRKRWVAKRNESTREVMQDRVAQTRIYRSWNLPPFGDAELDPLHLAAQILGGGKTSRLYRALVQEQRIADSVATYLLPFELASLLIVQADVKQGVDPALVEQAIDAELRRLLEEGPSKDELARAKTDLQASVLRGLERVGGFGGKSDLLARYEVYLDDPGAWKESLQRFLTATPGQVQQIARRWIADGDHTLVVTPYPEYRTIETDVDRSAGPPEVTQFPDLSFPPVERATLSNGLRVVLARRSHLPLVEMQLVFDAGFAADPASLPGTATMTMAMLDEGTDRRSAQQIAEEVERLGARLSTDADLDSCTVSMSALGENLSASLDLLADVVRNPRFDATEYARVQGIQLAAIRQEKTNPISMALRSLPPLLYGEGHPYSAPMTGSGTEDSVQRMRPADLRRFHARWLRPDNATVLVSGDVTLAQITAELERVFGDWQAPAEALPEKTLPWPSQPGAPRVFLVHRADTPQALILGGQLVPPSTDPRELLLDVANEIVGGSFTARINMNLREDKHWSYGARSFAPDAVGPRPLLVYAPVQIDRTADALSELDRELRDYVGKAPATEAELAKVRDSRVRSLPGRYETNNAVLGALFEIVRYGKPDDWVLRLKPALESMDVEQVRKIARELIHPERMTWLIVGDLQKIEQPVRALGLGEVTVLGPEALR